MKLSLFTTLTALALTTPTLYAIQDEESTHAVAKAIESYENYLIDVKGEEDVDIKMVASKSNKVSSIPNKSVVIVDHILWAFQLTIYHLSYLILIISESKQYLKIK